MIINKKKEGKVKIIKHRLPISVIYETDDIIMMDFEKENYNREKQMYE